jgi:DNA-binding response OmpR family regulator
MGDGPRIAIVNHEPVFLSLMQRILEVEGYQVTLCPEGTAAHAVIAREQPDLVILDTWLETREGGWTVLQTLRLDDATRNLPILICSSDPDEVKRRMAQLETMPDVTFLAKPFDPDSLRHKIGEILHRGGYGPK